MLPRRSAAVTGQGLGDFLRDYEAAHPDDVCTVDRPVSLDQDITAVVWELAGRGQHPLLRFPRVKGADREVVTNLFASRVRIERMLGARPVSVSATGGVAVFTPKDWAGERCLTCDAADTCPEYVDITQGRLKELYYDAEATSGYIFDTCVFNSEKDTVDHASASIEYEGGKRVSYSLCLFASYTTREIGVWGEDGKVEGRDGQDAFRFTGRRDDRDEERTVEVARGGHGGGDTRLLADALAVFSGERDPVAGLDAAYWAAVLGIAAAESVARGGRRLTLSELGATP